MDQTRHAIRVALNHLMRLVPLSGPGKIQCFKMIASHFASVV
jgi:hypothetical protein